MVQTSVKPLTLEAFLKRPETEPPSEYIDGRITQKPMPQGMHCRLQDKLANVINDAVKRKRIACAFPELRCTFGDSSIVPDIAIFLWKNIPLDDRGRITDTFLMAPDWTIEILSPGQSYKKVRNKILRCLENGTQAGWLIDPDDDLITVYKSKKDIAILDMENDADFNLPMPEFMQGLTFTVKDLFDLLIM